jgi:hypothetical protein
MRVSHVHYMPCETTECICLARSPRPCADRVREARYQLARGAEKVGTHVYLTRGIWGGYRRGHNIEAGKKSLRVRLLDSKIHYHRSPSIRHVINTWSNNPYTTVIADFEYHSRLLPCMKHEGIFEIALANANGDWIILPTSINHGISTLELCENANTQWHLLKEKFSGPNYDAQMPMWHSQVTKIMVRPAVVRPQVSLGTRSPILSTSTQRSVSLRYVINIPLTILIEARQARDPPRMEDGR